MPFLFLFIFILFLFFSFFFNFPFLSFLFFLLFASTVASSLEWLGERVGRLRVHNGRRVITVASVCDSEGARRGLAVYRETRSRWIVQMSSTETRKQVCSFLSPFCSFFFADFWSLKRFPLSWVKGFEGSNLGKIREK